MACEFKHNHPKSYVEWTHPSLNSPDIIAIEQRKNLSLFKKESEDLKCVAWDEADTQRQELVGSLPICSPPSVRNLVSYDSVVLDRPSKRVALNESARPWFTKWFGDFATLIDGDGEGITVGIVDSGCDLHQFQDVNSSPGTISGKSFVNDAWFIDVVGHGTHVAGIIWQVAPKCNLLIAQTLDRHGEGPLHATAKAIDWCVKGNAKIINLSLGASEYNHALTKAINRAVNKGVIIVAAASNDGNGLHNAVSYPARLGNVLSVGSCGEKGQASSFCSVGREVDFLLPGEDILSYKSVTKEADCGQMIEHSGTSMATPFLSGIIACILCKKRGSSATVSAEHYFCANLRELLRQYADGPHSADRGYGVLRYEKFGDNTATAVARLNTFIDQYIFPE
eukprot:ANDGO_07215.mRNA.1 Minor extracellular protease Epr